jgi:hypothetical protein
MVAVNWDTFDVFEYTPKGKCYLGKWGDATVREIVMDAWRQERS